jgi:hypothetical protein
VQSLAKSNYKTLYGIDPESTGPRSLRDIFDALRAFLELYARRHALPAASAEDLALRLEKEVEARRAQSASLEEVARVAQHVWSSGQRLKDVPAPYALELCSLLNQAIRLDDPALLAAAMPLIRSINSLCVVRGARPDRLLRFPSEGRSFRGTGVPEQFLGFFQPGTAFRVPGFLATSFDEKVGGPLVLAHEGRCRGNDGSAAVGYPVAIYRPHVAAIAKRLCESIAKRLCESSESFLSQNHLSALQQTALLVAVIATRQQGREGIRDLGSCSCQRAGYSVSAAGPPPLFGPKVRRWVDGWVGVAVAALLLRLLNCSERFLRGKFLGEVFSGMLSSQWVSSKGSALQRTALSLGVNREDLTGLFSHTLGRWRITSSSRPSTRTIAGSACCGLSTSTRGAPRSSCTAASRRVPAVTAPWRRAAWF